MVFNGVSVTENPDSWTGGKDHQTTDCESNFLFSTFKFVCIYGHIHVLIAKYPIPKGNVGRRRVFD